MEYMFAICLSIDETQTVDIFERCRTHETETVLVCY